MAEKMKYSKPHLFLMGDEGDSAYGAACASVGNSATYAPFVHGKEQAWFHVVHGWRELFGVAQEKQSEIQRIYQAWVDRLIKKTR